MGKKGDFALILCLSAQKKKEKEKKRENKIKNANNLKTIHLPFLLA